MNPARPTRLPLRRLQRMAPALGIVVAAAWSVGGCLLSPPPVIEGPDPGRPNVNMSQVVPPTYQLLTAEHNGPPIEFTIPVSAEDAGDTLWALTWVNWTLDREEFIFKRPFPPDPGAGMGGAGPTERAIALSWRPNALVGPGCNQLTIFLVHESYADLQNDRPYDFNKAAMISWWVNVDPVTGEERDLVDCPGPGIPTLVFP